MSKDTTKPEEPLHDLVELTDDELRLVLQALGSVKFPLTACGLAAGLHAKLTAAAKGRGL